MRTIIIALLALASVTMQAQHCEDLPWEANLVYQINSGSSVGWRNASMFVSDMGVPVAVGVPVAFYLTGIAGLSSDPANNRYTAETGLQSAVTVGLSGGLVLLLKEIIGRPRPFVDHPDCITPYGGSRDYSMPSGHSTMAAAIATTLSLRYPEWYVIGPSVLYALYTGISRMHLGMHYLSDVLLGYAIGAGIAWGVNAINNELFDLADPILPSAGSGTSLIIAPSHLSLISVSYSL